MVMNCRWIQMKVKMLHSVLELNIRMYVKYFFFCLLFCGPVIGHGQSMENMREDTTTVIKLLKSANTYDFSKADSGLLISEKALQMARDLHYKKGEADALHIVGESFHILGDFPQSLKMQFEALRIDREM